MTYDKRNQITAADDANPRTDESYAYDDNGNRTGGSYTTGKNNQTTADANYIYTYDKEGNRTRRTKKSDSSYEEYTWDHRNHLTKVSFKTSGGTETKNVEYAYDLFNRLIRRKLDADGPGSGAATNLYLVGYDGINPTLALDGTAKTDVINRFLWGPAVDQSFAAFAVRLSTLGVLLMKSWVSPAWHFGRNSRCFSNCELLFRRLCLAANNREAADVEAADDIGHVFDIEFLPFVAGLVVVTVQGPR